LSGIGGFDLAAEWMGWTNAFHCEWEEFPRKVLQYHFPESKSYGDINETDFTIWNKKIDILTGGFPCQPYSAAGKRLGKEDERHLWPQMLRAIREIEPRWIIGENVYGLVSWNDGMVFEEVQVDLENEGYEVQPYILPAAAVNAPHRRDRVWFVAHSDGNGHKRRQPKSSSKTNTEQNSSEFRTSCSDNIGATSGYGVFEKEPSSNRLLRQSGIRGEGKLAAKRGLSGVSENSTNKKGSDKTNWGKENSDRSLVQDRFGTQLSKHRELGETKKGNEGDSIRQRNDRDSIEGMDRFVATDTNLFRDNKCAEKSGMEGEQSKSSEQSRYRRAGQVSGSYAQSDAANSDSRRLERSIKIGRNSIDVEWKSQSGNATNTDKVRLQFSEDTRKVRAGQNQVCGAGGEFTDAIKADGEKRNATNANSIGQHEFGSYNSEQKSEWRKTTIGRTDREQVDNGQAYHRPNDFEQFPTQSPVCGRDDGIPRELDSITFPKWRNESIKAYGNAIVPQVAYQLFKTIEKYEEMY